MSSRLKGKNSTKNNNKKNKGNVSNIFEENFFSGIFVCIMFTIYPLFFHNKFFDIVSCKYEFLKIIIIIITVIEALCFSLYLMDRIMAKEKLIKKEKIRITPLYIFVFSWFAINLISALLSEYKDYVMDGAAGRSAGFKSVLCYFIIFIIVSKLYKDSDIAFYGFLISSVLISILGILNGMNIDPLGFFKGLDARQIIIYLSTLGNMDIYTLYFSLSIPLILMHYLKEKDIRKKILYLLGASINIIAITAGQCDMAYIIIVFSLFLVMIFNKEEESIVILLLPYFLSVLPIYMLAKANINADITRNVSKITYGYFKIYPVFIVLFLILLFINSKKKIYVNKLKKSAFIFLVSGLILYFILLILFTFILKDVDLSGFSTFLRFNNEFGSYRGFIWKKVIEEYLSFNFIGKLIGIGPDTLYPYLMENCAEEMMQVTKTYYDNAHNEFLQYLITTGILGLVSYVGIIFFALKNGIKAWLENKNKKYIYLPSVILYLLMTFININQVVTTPLFIIMLAIVADKQVCE